jgi:Ni/Co efflux regulator RcnB
MLLKQNFNQTIKILRNNIMKKFMLAFMAVACVAAFTTTAKAEEATTAPAMKTEAPAKAEATKEVKKVKHHAKKHKKAEVKTEVKAETAPAETNK